VGERAVLCILGKINISWYYEDSNPALANYYVDYASFVKNQKSSGFLSGAGEVFVVLRYRATSLGAWLPTFRARH